jgi:hypothetical protein
LLLLSTVAVLQTELHVARANYHTRTVSLDYISVDRTLEGSEPVVVKEW